MIDRTQEHDFGVVLWPRGVSDLSLGGAESALLKQAYDEFFGGKKVGFP
jgi:hypothetical protein